MAGRERQKPGKKVAQKKNKVQTSSTCQIEEKASSLCCWGRPEDNTHGRQAQTGAVSKKGDNALVELGASPGHTHNRGLPLPSSQLTRSRLPSTTAAGENRTQTRTPHTLFQLVFNEEHGSQLVLYKPFLHQIVQLKTYPGLRKFLLQSRRCQWVNTIQRFCKYL